jgi:hypothetical protein
LPGQPSEPRPPDQASVDVGEEGHAAAGLSAQPLVELSLEPVVQAAPVELLLGDRSAEGSDLATSLCVMAHHADPGGAEDNSGMDDAVRDYVDAIAPERRPLFDRLHRLILEAHPDAAMVLSYLGLGLEAGPVTAVSPPAKHHADDTTDVHRPLGELPQRVIVNRHEVSLYVRSTRLLIPRHQPGRVRKDGDLFPVAEPSRR